MKKRLYRSKSKRMISGVCGGLENYLGIDVTIIRLVYVILTISTGFFPGLIIYVVATAIVPEDPNEIIEYAEGYDFWKQRTKPGGTPTDGPVETPNDDTKHSPENNPSPDNKEEK